MRDVHVVDAVRTPFGGYDGSPPAGLPHGLAAHTVRELLAPVPAERAVAGQELALALAPVPAERAVAGQELALALALER
ncbi:hypothetical protein [Streptomyces sp. NPDC088358]|uniref:hypothetical protein n=1 Tax=Streptomyces sp. NPDC088358 TaxID=3365857 RepID=UPI0038100F45